MSISLPSKRIATVDVPEVKTFSAGFTYNFFTQDESVNDSGTTVPDFIETRPLQDFDTQFISSRNFNRFTPRFVSFEWRAVPYGNRPELNSISIRNNYEKIHNEETFITDDFTNIVFQDTGEDSKMAYFIRQAINSARTDQENGETSSEESPLDIVKFLNSNTSDTIKGNFLAENFIRYANTGINFLNEDLVDEITQTTLAKTKNVRTKTQINNKFLNTLLKTVSQNPLNIFDDETAKVLPQSIQIQQKATSQGNSSIISGQDYDFEILDFIDYRVIDPNAFDSTLQIIGYVIDKTEYTNNGPVTKDPIIVESPFATTTVDLQVRYGARYGYSIRSIGYVELATEDAETNEIIAISFLVSSRTSPEMIVECIEEIPPPPPADFNIGWNYQENAPMLSWSFPVNTQRDVKYFQIFKRNSINEPYQLIKMYDFNDSQTPVPFPEMVDNILVERNPGVPTGFFLDLSFKKGQKAIYTLCCVDAHGYSSNYTTQFEIIFDQFKNKLVKTLVSIAGAPKAYPNFFLQRDTFVDSIKTSGTKELRIIFNPEYLNVVDRNGNDQGLLKTDEKAVYKFQMINLDLQKQQTINLKLLDKRPSKQKNS